MLSLVTSYRVYFYGLILLLGSWSQTAVGQSSTTMVHEKEAVQLWGETVMKMAKDSRELIKNIEQPNQACSAKALPQEGHSFENDTPLNSSSKAFSESASPLTVFISFSMSYEDIKRLYQDVSKAGGKLVLRGLLNNSFKQTAVKLQSLGVIASIDPMLFEQHGVKSVPQFVIADERGHDSLNGNVSVQFALEQFAQNGSKAARNLLEAGKETAL